MACCSDTLPMKRTFHTLLFLSAPYFAPRFAIAQLPTVEPAELRNARATYQQQTKAATDPIKGRYIAYLESLKKVLESKKDQIGLQAVQAELESLGVSPVASPVTTGGGAKLIIWNTNNNGKGDRGATRVNLVLSAGGKETWHLNGVPLKWEADNEMKKEFDIPAARVDKIRVEVTGLRNERGGLAEIEFIKDGKNLAKNRPVEVSAI
ncbi:MAG: hypothetical protein JWO08_2787 [Verrucomicrobiaceae bacterium]|nr:hypothetical protein [Verrucomicrobiaceae bacterium]